MLSDKSDKDKPPISNATDHDIKTNQSTIKEPLVIGEGSYGKIIRIDSRTVQKVSSLLEKNKDIIDANIKELCFLSTFHHPHIRGIQDINITKNNITTNLIDKGIDLHAWTNNTPFKLRIEALPIIIYQIAVTLRFLSYYNIIHNDLKPSNILINKNYKISIIDWGAVAIIPRLQDTCLCTHQVAAPELLGAHPKLSSTSDIWSLGMIISFIINKIYDIPRDILKLTNKYGFYPLSYPYHRILKHRDCKYYVNLLNRCRDMLWLNPHKRVKANQICEWPEFINYHDSKITDNMFDVKLNTQLTTINWNKYKHITIPNRSSIIELLMILSTDQISLTIIPHSVWLMDQYLDRFCDADVSVKEYELIGVTCLLIMYTLLITSANLTDFKTTLSVSYEDDEMIGMYTTIIAKFNYHIIHKSWIDINENWDKNTVKKLLLDPNNINKTEDEKRMIYHNLIKSNSDT